jgi:hypothetical protein
LAFIRTNAPDSRYALGIHVPAQGSKQHRDPAITVTAELTGKIHDGLGERRFVVRHFGGMMLGRARLSKHTAGPVFRNAKRLLDMMHTVPTTISA